MLKFHRIPWCRTLWKRTVSAEFWSFHSQETLQKLCVFRKFPSQKISWNYGILRNIYHSHTTGFQRMEASAHLCIVEKTIRTNDFHFHFFLIGVLVGSFDLAPRPRVFIGPRPRPRPVSVFLRLCLSSKIENEISVTGLKMLKRMAHGYLVMILAKRFEKGNRSSIDSRFQQSKSLTLKLTCSFYGWCFYSWKYFWADDFNIYVLRIYWATHWNK